MITNELFYGRMDENGVPAMDDPEGFRIAKLALAGKPFQIHITECDPNALVKMRKYFHGVVIPYIADAAGHAEYPEIQQLEKDVIKEIQRRTKIKLKGLFLTVPSPPEEDPTIRSTESLTVGEYWMFIEHCRRWAAETYRIVIPDPH